MLIDKKYNIAVIIVNYNSSEFTINCIKSIHEKTSSEILYQIVVVDNNSEINSYNYLKSNLSSDSKVKLIRSKLNLGFSGGNMLGVQSADAEYVFFLNNDTILLNDYLRICYHFLKEHENTAICIGQMYNKKMNYVRSFTYFPSIMFNLFGTSIVRLFNRTGHPKRSGKFNEPVQVPVISGSSMFIDYNKFAEVGGFDTNYFMFCEEEDICMKFKRCGYYAYFVPEARYIHFQGKSTSEYKQQFEDRHYKVEREYYISLLYFYRKYYNFFQYNLLKIFYFFKLIRRVIRHKWYFKLAFLVLIGASMKNSLRHEQKLAI